MTKISEPTVMRILVWWEQKATVLSIEPFFFINMQLAVTIVNAPGTLTDMSLPDLEPTVQNTG